MLIDFARRSCCVRTLNASRAIERRIGYILSFGAFHIRKLQLRYYFFGFWRWFLLFLQVNLGSRFQSFCLLLRQYRLLKTLLHLEQTSWRSIHSILFPFLSNLLKFGDLFIPIDLHINMSVKCPLHPHINRWIIQWSLVVFWISIT